MGSAADDLKKKRQEEIQAQQRENERQLQSAGDRQFEAGMKEVIDYKKQQDEEDRMLQAARDLKAKRASEGKIRYGNVY